MQFSRLRQQIWGADYYRLHPLRTARFLHSKAVFARNRVRDPLTLLRNWAVDPGDARADLASWEPELRPMLASVAAAEGEQGAVSWEDGLVLYGAVRALRPAAVVETGVAAGVSAAFLSAALIDNGEGTLYSIELPPENVQAARQADGALFAWPSRGVAWAIPASISERIGRRHLILLGDVRSELPALLAALGTIDLFFHDDLHTAGHMRWEYDLAWRHLKPGGLLVSDDVNEGWLEFCRAKGLPSTALANLQRLAMARKPQ
jgi:predicted O-methyltransferase YrrM